VTSLRVNPSHYFALACILLAALGVRFGVARHWQNKLAPGVMFEFGDSETYWQLGETIYRGEPYAYGPREYRVMRTPGYPVLLAALMRVTSGAASAWDARVLSISLGCIAVLLTYLVARMMLDARAGLIAAAISALAPCAVASSVFVLAEAPFIPVMLGQLACWWASLTTISPRRALLLAGVAGLLAGLGVLIRPSWLLFTPFASGAMLLVRRRRLNWRALQFSPAFICLLIMAAVLAPWWIRNYQVSGRFIATTLQAGPSLYDGWRPDADGSSDMRFVDDFESRVDERPEVPAKGIEREIVLDSEMSRAAKNWASQNPDRVLQLAAVKLLRTWNVMPNFAEMQSMAMRLAVMLGYTPVMITAGLGAWKFRARWDLLLVCLLPAIYFSALHMIYVGSIRYRQPAMFPLFVLSAAWLASFGRPAFALVAKEAVT
jgi:4-amino-4-deoxy-L-arabinose transferase-like glycosyltransferase